MAFDDLPDKMSDTDHNDDKCKVDDKHSLSPICGRLPVETFLFCIYFNHIFHKVS